MAGLGYKQFVAGEVLTAANLQGYAVDQSVMVFASSAARTTALPTPSQGMVSWLDDVGVMQTYYGLYNVSTNPAGRDSAGWYSTSRVDGLVPVAPTSVDKAGTSATANSVGAVTFTAVTSLSLNGVFTSGFRNYQIVLNVPTGSATLSVGFRLRAAGVDLSSASYNTAQQFLRENSTTQLNAGTGVTSVSVCSITNVSNRANVANIGVYSPQVATGTSIQTYGQSNDATSGFMLTGGSSTNVTTQFDGFSLIPTAGNITGVVSVYGFNNQ